MTSTIHLTLTDKDLGSSIDSKGPITRLGLGVLSLSFGLVSSIGSFGPLMFAEANTGAAAVLVDEGDAGHPE